MGSEYMEELYKPDPEEEADAVSSPTDAAENQCDMVGSSYHFRNFRDILISSSASERIPINISGMAGIGKTTIAKKLFNDSLVKEKFEGRAFVRVGQKYQFEDILRAILAQLNVEMIMEGDENIQEYFKRNLMDRELLIVLDDVWDSNLVTNCQQLMSRGIFVATSRIRNIVPEFWDYEMRFRNEDESWELLCWKVFGEGECPPLLVKPGKKIAENCEGLPLLVVTIAQLLSESPKKPEYWKEVAEMKNSVFEDAIDVLLPSYHYLTQHLKACFLYMAVFPKNYVVRRSRIINLWRAERFVDYHLGYVLDEIFSNNLVVNSEPRYIRRFKYKTFNLHVVYRHLCKREGKNTKFLCILNRYADADASIEDMRYLAIYHNTLLAIKEVHNSITSVSTLRSVLCTGPYHQYQVPIICLELRLLRLLDALNIRFYEFPVEVVKQIQLRYLSLTTNANIPPFIHKLWFLQFLILHQHLRINRGVAESYVPVEIWELQELEHLQIIGRNLPHPPPGAILPKLRKLLDVGVQSCAKEVLESMPKLEKLRIQIESAPDDAQTMICFDHIICLKNIKSLGSVVVNPNLLPKPTVPHCLLSVFISSVLKLSLSGFGYPWEYMSKISDLPHLEALKLRCYAFRGEKWEAKEMRFQRLWHLLIEDTDLVQWTATNETFPQLDCLTLKNCHKLHEIPLMKNVFKTELVDCNPLAETWAKQKYPWVTASYSWK